MRGTAKQTAPRRRPLGFLSVLGATSKVREEAMAEVEEEEEGSGRRRSRRKTVEEEKKKLLGEPSRPRNFSVGFIRASF